MLNSTNVGVNFDNKSAQGLLCKSMNNSVIIRFDVGSPMEDFIFSKEGQCLPKNTVTRYTRGEDIIVLQVLLMSQERSSRIYY